MGLRKFFGHKQKPAKDQGFTLPTTLRQFPKEPPPAHEPPAQQQPRYFTPSPSPAAPPTAEIPLIAYAPSRRISQIRQDLHRPPRGVIRARNENQLPPFPHPHIRSTILQQDLRPPTRAVCCTRCGSRYRTQSTTICKSPDSSPGSVPPDPCLVDTLALLCRILIFIFCFAISMFVTVACLIIWILAKLLTSLEASGTVLQQEEEEADEEIDRVSNTQPAHMPAEDAYWRVMAWAYEQSFRQLQSQECVPPQHNPDQGPECVAATVVAVEPEPRGLARGAAREAWAIHAICPHCHD